MENISYLFKSVCGPPTPPHFGNLVCYCCCHAMILNWFLFRSYPARRTQVCLAGYWTLAYILASVLSCGPSARNGRREKMLRAWCFPLVPS